MRFREYRKLLNPDGSAAAAGQFVETDLAPLLQNGFTTTKLRAVVQDHIVSYEGDFTTPADAANGMTLFTTPVELAPDADVTIGVFADDGTDYGVIRFEADGDVKVYGSLTVSKKYTISGVTIIDPYNRG